MENPSERLVLETPENITFGYEISDLGTRSMAILVDSFIQFVMLMVFLFAFYASVIGLALIALPDWAGAIIAIIGVLGVFMISFGYFLVFELFMHGQTPGKRVMNLRVIKDNGYPLAPLDAVLRNLIRIIDFFPIFYGIGIPVMFLNRRAKRLGDFAAGTIVVKIRKEVKLGDLSRLTPPAASHTAPTTAMMPRLDESELELAENFLKRRSQLTNADELSMQVARRLATELKEPTSPATPSEAVAWLTATIQRYRQIQ